MKKLTIVAAAAMLLLAGPACASPLQDLSAGRWSVDLNWKRNSFIGGNAFELGVTAGLGSGWAVGGRQLGYDTAGVLGEYRVRHREINLIRKIGDNLQLYAGHARTAGGAAAVKNTAQLGLIATRKLGDRFILFGNLGGGSRVANVEFGLSYSLRPDLELTAVYRHLTVDRAGRGTVKDNYRGFGLGVTWKI